MQGQGKIISFNSGTTENCNNYLDKLNNQKYKLLAVFQCKVIHCCSLLTHTVALHNTPSQKAFKFKSVNSRHRIFYGINMTVLEKA